MGFVTYGHYGKAGRLLLAFLTCVLVAVAAYPHAEAHSGVSLSGYGTATIDGNIQAGEWAAAGTKTFGPLAGGYNGILYMMNDGTNLYVAVSISGDDEFGVGPSDGLYISFDNDHGGGTSPQEGDDGLFYYTPPFFDDAFYQVAVGWRRDIDVVGGTSEAQGGGSRQGALNHFELSHPLDSADDAHDFSLSVGQTVGFGLRIYVDGTGYPLSAYGLGDILDPSNYANYVIASPPPAPPPAPVGGVLVPVNKLDLLAPYLALVGLVGAVSTVFAIRKKRKP